MIRFDSVCKRYSNNTQAVSDLSFKCREGEICVIIGSSGCGKSTTLRMINRLIEPTSGQIYIDGKSIYDYKVTELRRNIGYAIQEVALFPNMTVGANISVVQQLKGWDKKKREERVHELLNLIGLDPDVYKNKYPNELSGGERQRIGVARAMGADPPIMLMDEPFGAIDPITRLKLQDELLAIQDKVKKTIVFVTHDINEALKLADSIVILRNGKLVQQGAPQDIILNPSDSYVENFMGNDRIINWLKLRKVEDIMIKDPIVTTADDKSNSILSKMESEKCSYCLIIDNDGHLKGYVHKPNTSSIRSLNTIQNIHPIEEKVNFKTSVLNAFFLMYNRKVNFMPVIDDNNKIKGLITMEEVNRFIKQAYKKPEEMAGEIVYVARSY